MEEVGAQLGVLFGVERGVQLVCVAGGASSSVRIVPRRIDSIFETACNDLFDLACSMAEPPGEPAASSLKRARAEEKRPMDMQITVNITISTKTCASTWEDVNSKTVARLNVRASDSIKMLVDNIRAAVPGLPPDIQFYVFAEAPVWPGSRPPLRTDSTLAACNIQHEGRVWVRRVKVGIDVAGPLRASLQTPASASQALICLYVCAGICFRKCARARGSKGWTSRRDSVIIMTATWAVTTAHKPRMSRTAPCARAFSVIIVVDGIQNTMEWL